ncbi:hypothetical protein SARC_06435 [Sphaeroforma arctica JP610]|uniref:Dynein heavy chain C-terminal domain-containing protein n=1 Tax=Sphaeroforma arctica JP610 TaxID=667725 RepID=A0A0L0FX65_9EUKA|nr:hypothetical protein SARC_06435 [Sphaeroforma arctica JP610]KNC81234.1 hypothetical protein SARC_06435 [Sphaeroforma arctica JP610]|eukprot:XP_014155136.1 hypothetical protein SARC_06435 [Sphaeroforma arctica JP610]
MEQLEKTKLHTLKPADGFRLFMSMEINSKIAVNLLRMSRIVTLEPPPGIRASLLQTLHGIPTERMDRQPAERSRVYFLLAWLHALVQERLRYAPVGWSKKYEFSESDLRVGLSTVDSWIDRTTGGSGSNIAPERIPWTALKALLSQCIYGGRVDNAFDRHLLDAFLSHLFVAQSFDIDFALVNSSTNNETPHAGVVIPDARNKAEYLAWVEQWSGESSESPMLLGLHANADSALHATLAKRLRTNLQTVQVSVGVGVGAVEGETSAEDLKATEKNVNHRNAAELAAKWLAALPEDVKELRRDNDNIKQPLFRCFEREVSGGKQLLRKVRRALTLVIGVCNGDKQSNKGRALLHDILMATIPHAWRRYTVPVGLALPEWMVDFTARMTQLQSISAGVEQGELLQDIWLGGLMYPEAYITATRQAVAQANKWSLEELSLQLQLDVSDGSATSGFMVTSLYIDGAKPDPQAGLSLDTRGSVEMMSKNKLVWIHESSNTAAQTSDHLTLPLYLNHSRQNLLSTAAVHCSIPQVKVYQRAVALYASVVGK